jgi:hypothetical protein
MRVLIVGAGAMADTSAAGCCKGDYLQAFMIAGAAGIVAAVLSLMIGWRPAQPLLAAV